jgi:membrane-associated HD superfamily phosphohydrolase
VGSQRLTASAMARRLLGVIFGTYIFLVSSHSDINSIHSKVRELLLLLLLLLLLVVVVVVVVLCDLSENKFCFYPA